MRNGGLIASMILLFVSASSLTGFFIVNYASSFVSHEQMFWVACFLTVVTMVMLYFFDETEMVRKNVSKSEDDILRFK